MTNKKKFITISRLSKKIIMKHIDCTNKHKEIKHTYLVFHASMHNVTFFTTITACIGAKGCDSVVTSSNINPQVNSFICQICTVESQVNISISVVSQLSGVMWKAR